MTAREDARLSGGTLQAWGKTGYGSSFLLTLPRRHDMEMGASPLDVTDYVEPTLDTYVPPQSTPQQPENPTNATRTLGKNGEEPC